MPIARILSNRTLKHFFQCPDRHANGTFERYHSIMFTCLSIHFRLVKLQLQLQRSPSDRQFKGPIDCARQVVRAQGIQGLWTGFIGSLAFRSNFFWMFLSFEVSDSPHLDLWHQSIIRFSEGFHERVLKTRGDTIRGMFRCHRFSAIAFSPADKHRPIQFSIWRIWIIRILGICNTS